VKQKFGWAYESHQEFGIFAHS